MRSGKTYYQIAQVIANAKKSIARRDAPVIYCPSERMKKQVGEIAQMMGVKVEARVTKCGLKEI